MSLIRKVILEWVKSCSSYIQADVRTREITCLVYSCYITTPFAIISVDIWKLGDTVNTDDFICLLNSMCNMSQFVVVVGVNCTESSYIARIFMKNVLLKFGLCSMVMVDTTSESCEFFQKMYPLLYIRFYSVVKRNHKAICFEYFHDFLNHSQCIYPEERGKPTAFFECGTTTVYVWYASPIDDTDIIRSLPTIGRVLHYSLDFHKSPLLNLIDNRTQSIIENIRHLGRDVKNSLELLAWVTEDRQVQHRECTNMKRKFTQYKTLSWVE